ncbi:MAG: hypothetical protein AB7C97_13070 [Oscillospiraceae bacterium]
MDSKFIFLFNNKPRDFFSFIVCALCFTAGSLAGTFYAMQIKAAGALPQFFSSISSVIGTQYAVNFLSVFKTVLLFPLVAVFLAYTIFGFLLIPALSAIKGFLLSFSVAYAARILGSEGILTICCMFAISELFVLPCFFVFASRSCVTSLSLFRTSLGAGGRPFSFLYPYSPKSEFLILIIVLGFAAAFEAYFKYPLLMFILKI